MKCRGNNVKYELLPPKVFFRMKRWSWFSYLFICLFQPPYCL